MGITQLVTGLAVAAAGCVGVNAMQLDFGMDVLRDKISSMSAACDVETSHGALQTVADNVRDGINDLDVWQEFIGLPITGMVMTNDGDNSVHLSSFRDGDERDDNSFYASTSRDLHKAVIFIFDVESNGILLQAVDNAAHFPVGNGMFLGANKQYDSDEEYEGMLRLIVHSDPQKAIIWQFVTVCNRTYLVVKENRDEAAKDTAGWYVAVPPDSKRDRKSHYLAISPQVRDAMPVSAVPAVPDSLP